MGLFNARWPCWSQVRASSPAWKWDTNITKAAIPILSCTHRSSSPGRWPLLLWGLFLTAILPPPFFGYPGFLTLQDGAFGLVFIFVALHASPGDGACPLPIS